MDRSWTIEEMDELYSVIYNGENLYDYKMNSEEQEIIEDLRKELMELCNSLEIPRNKIYDGNPYYGRLRDDHDFKMLYEASVGFIVMDGERGVFRLRKGFPTKSRAEAKALLLKSELESGGFQLELNNREKLTDEWSEKYKEEYDFRKPAFEYVIKTIKQVFGVLDTGIVKEYSGYMNLWFPKEYWTFNEDKMEFIEMIS